MISKTPIENFNKKFDVVSVFIGHDNDILLLHRQDHKSQGNTWGAPAGKVDEGEDLAEALVREVEEETGIKIEKEKMKYFEGYFVRYPGYDFTYHVYHVNLTDRPHVVLGENEHKGHVWIKSKEALNLNLIQDEDSCIKWFYNLD